MRTRKGAAKNRSRKRLLKAAKGYRAARSKRYRVAKETLRRAWRYSWIHRRRKKREFRRLWIVRVNAAVRMRGMSYSQFVAGLRRGDIALNRKILAELAVADPAGFDSVVALAKSQL